MAADDLGLQMLQLALKELDYDGVVTAESAPLLKLILSDLKSLSEHCNILEKENAELNSQQRTSILELNDHDGTRNNGTNSNDTYVLDVVDMANQKINSLVSELEKVRSENIQYKRAKITNNV